MPGPLPRFFLPSPCPKGGQRYNVRTLNVRTFRGAPLGPREDTAPPLVEALRVTGLFLNYYSHVVPFDRRVIEEAWGRCGGEDCEVERARTEKLLWGLDGSASQ